MFVHQLINIKNILDKVSNYDGVDFAYTVFKNKRLIENKLMEVDFIKNVSQEIIEYENIRVGYCNQYSKKDANGNPIIENEIYLIEDDKKEEFKSKMDELYEKYKPFIDVRQKQIEMFNEKMNKEIDFEFIKLKKEQLSPKVKTANDLEELSFMIE
jgi:hypothetical protein